MTGALLPPSRPNTPMIKFVLIILLTATAFPISATPITVSFASTGAAPDSTSLIEEDINIETNHSTTLLTNWGNASTVTNINWSGDKDGVTFLYDTIHHVDGVNNPVSAQYPTNFDYADLSGNIFFTADESINYGISGFYATSGGAPHFTSFATVLYDITANTHLFFDRAESQSVIDESFILGDNNGGTDVNYEWGSTTGELIAGHEYAFYFGQNISDLSETGIVASATGQICLTIGNGSCIAKVPEPATPYILGLGLILIYLKRTDNKVKTI